MDLSFLPRGVGPDATEKAPDRRWGDPSRLSRKWDYSDGKVLLGSCDGRFIGDPDAEGFLEGSGDDRHIVTIAGSRAGKSGTVLIPNLRRYPGSAVVIDPKGELASATASTRSGFGDVFVLDPFNITPPEISRFRASFNPLQELQQSRPESIAADAATIADALIESNTSEGHWTDSARNLIRGIVLHMISPGSGLATLKTLRQKLTGESEAFVRLLHEMKANSDVFDGIVANTGRGFLAKLDSGKPSPELRSIVSTANEQTWPLDDVTSISKESGFWLSSLTETPMTIYLVLPATRMATHAKWLRLFINLTIAAIERNPVKNPRGGDLPVWVVLEEFAALGNMRSIETAAGFMAGMGCKLWVVLQDLTQIKTHYPHSWETFLGNAGIIQAWSNVDATTTEYLSKLIGQTTILETRMDSVSSHGHRQGDIGERTQFRTVPLLDPAEVTLHFSRETGRQLILVPGRPPIAINRLRMERER